MLITQIKKGDVVNSVMENVRHAKKEVLATMLLSEEIISPLPILYHRLLIQKINNGIVLKRLGFGRKEDYNTIKDKIGITSEQYIFRYSAHVEEYQRLLIVDRKIIFFGVGQGFYSSVYAPIIKAFLNYFLDQFERGKL